MSHWTSLGLFLIKYHVCVRISRISAKRKLMKGMKCDYVLSRKYTSIDYNSRNG